MANHLHGSEPEAQRLRLLPQHQIPRLLLPVLQGRPACETNELAGEGYSEWVRIASHAVSEYAGFV